MRVTQSTLEKTSYLLLLLVFVAALFIGAFTYREGQQIKQQTTIIKNNQYTNTKAQETFIREGLVCLALLPPNPNPTPAQVQAGVDKCFANTPEVK